MKKILIISLILISSLFLYDKVYALDIDDNLNVENLSGNIDIEITENNRKLTIKSIDYGTGIYIDIISDGNVNKRYSYNKKAILAFIKKGSSLYIYNMEKTNSSSDTYMSSDSYELIENNNYIKINNFLQNNLKVSNYGQYNYYSFTNDSISNGAGGFNNILSGESIIYYTNVKYKTNDNKIYNFNLETPPPITPPVEINQLIDLSLFMIINPDDLDNLFDKYNIVHLSKVESEYMITLFVANLFAYIIITLIIICIFKVLKLFFGSGKRNSIF